MSVFEDVLDEKLICSHCGDKCDDKITNGEREAFCCQGCKTVHEILYENGLDAYYRIEKKPGISLKNSKGKDHYSYLQNENIQQRILDYKSEELSKIRLSIPSIHCSSCIWLLENLYKLQEGVLTSRVNFPKKEVYVDFDPRKISLQELIELLSSLGYEPEINLENAKENRKIAESNQKSLIIKIGVAGFCFGNIMLLSLPEYFGLEGITDGKFSRFFSMASIAFSFPVVLYCASDYFRAAIQGLRQKLVSIDLPIAIGIVTLLIRSLFEVISQTGSGYFDSLSGLVFFLLLGKWFQNRTYESLLFDRNYKSYFPVAVTRVNGDKKESVLIEEIKEGEWIIVRNGELIPADSELLSETALIDNSFVTGESEPISRKRGDYIYAGGRQKGAAIKLEIKKDVSQSYLTQLWNNKAFDKNIQNERQVLVDKISRHFTWIILAIAVSASIFWLINDPDKMGNAFTAVLIVACPCALALSTPFAVGTAMRILGRNGCYLKNGEIIEEFPKIDHVVFDKTGTITVHGDRNLRFVGDLSNNEKAMVAALAGNSYHPLSRQIANGLKNHSDDRNNYDLNDFEETPGGGITACIDGKIVKLGSDKFVGSNFRKERSLSSSRVFISINNSILGYFEIQNSYRAGLDLIISKMAYHKELSVLSGDNDAEKNYLKSIFPSGSELKFSQTAYQKLEYVKELQVSGKRVLMVGDGLNDAGALAQSDIGLAVTEDVNNFTPASDVILAGKAFMKLPAIMTFSGATVKVIVLSFIISFIYNIVGISFAVTGNLTPVFAAILMPLSSITVVTFATGAVRWLGKKYGLQ